METERLRLREFRSDADWAAFLRHTNTPQVMHWLAGVMSADAVAAQRQRVENCVAANGFCFWLVERLDDGGWLAGEVLGFCGLKRADAPGSSITGEMEIGWRFRADSWGRGYAREAACAALTAGFGRFGADRIVALTVEGNTPSWGLMKRLGMVRREDLDYADARYDPPFRDTIVYAITREQWENAP